MKRIAVMAVFSVLVLSCASLARGADDIPAFPNFSFFPLDGGPAVEMETYRGLPVLVTFWASWCGPCRVELPELQRLQTELADSGFVLLTVNVDQSQKAAELYLQRLGLDIPVYRLRPGDLLHLGVRALPTNILLDLTGRPAQIYTGYSPTLPADIRELVLGMVRESGPGGDEGGGP